MKRKEIKQALKDMPIEVALMVGKSDLTSKQREFAKNVALGYTGAESYRKSYNTATTKKRQGDQASRMKADPRIAAEIEAYELALEAAKYRSSESLRALVIQSLVNVLIDPETKQSQKVAAAKVLGTVTEVAAFTERKEITTVNGSDTIKTQIMDQLKTLMLGSGNPDITDVDAIDLLSELQGSEDEDDLDYGDPTHPAPPAVEESESPASLHTIPHEQSDNFSIPHEQFPQNSIEPHLSQDTPLSSENEDPPGGI